MPLNFVCPHTNILIYLYAPIQIYRYICMPRAYKYINIFVCPLGACMPPPLRKILLNFINIIICPKPCNRIWLSLLKKKTCAPVQQVSVFIMQSLKQKKSLADKKYSYYYRLRKYHKARKSDLERNKISTRAEILFPAIISHL